MSKRRSFGRVRKLPSGHYQARYPTLGGELVPAPRTFPNRRQAESFLSRIQIEQEEGSWVDHRSGQVTLTEYSAAWLGVRALRPSTAAKYRGLLKNHLLPAFGQLALADITPTAVRRWHAELARSKPDTASQAYRLLSAIFNTAVEDAVVPRSPCRVRGASQHRNPPRPTLTIEEVDRAVSLVDEPYRLAILLATWCQLRRGEVLGLQRRHIDLGAQTIAVEQAWTSVDGKMELGPPKTDAGRRVLEVPPHLVADIATHLAAMDRTDPDAWLFPGDGKAPVAGRTIDRAWTRVREDIGRPEVTFHDLRHSGLTWAAATGAPTAELMKRGGHSNPTAALRYQHATREGGLQLANGLSDLATASRAKGHAGGTRTDLAITRAGGQSSDNPDPKAPFLVLVEPPDHTETSSDQGTVAPFQRALGDVLAAQRDDNDAWQSQRGSNPCLHLERVVS